MPDAFTRGSRALIIDFDADREAYVVEPVTDLYGAPLLMAIEAA